MRRKAFTAVEFLVAAAIILMLMGLVIKTMTNEQEDIVPDGNYFYYDDVQKEALDVVQNVVYVRCEQSNIVYAIYTKSKQYDGYKKGYGWGYGYMSIVPPDMVGQIKHLIINRGADD